MDAHGVLEITEKDMELASELVPVDGTQYAFGPTLAPALIPADVLAKLKVPLPPEAVSPHPTKNYLSTIKVIYVVERFNEVFGMNGWFVEDTFVAREGKMVVLKLTVRVPKYGIVKTQFGGNDNSDLGDAYKGAYTDALSKIGSYLYVGMDVYKGLADPGPAPEKKSVQKKLPPPPVNPGASKTIEEMVVKNPHAGQTATTAIGSPKKLDQVRARKLLTRAEANGWTKPDVQAYLKDKYGYQSSKDIELHRYAEIQEVFGKPKA